MIPENALNEAILAYIGAKINKVASEPNHVYTELDDRHYLLRFGHQIVAPMLELFQDEDPIIRAAIADELANMVGDSRIVAPLINALHDPDPGVRSSAAHTLGETDHIGVIDELIAATKDTNVGVRGSAVHALGHFINCKPALNAMISIIRYDEVMDIRIDTAEYLAHLGGLAELKIVFDDGLKISEHSITKILREIGGNGAFECMVLFLKCNVSEEERAELMSRASRLWSDTEVGLSILSDCLKENDTYKQRMAAQVLSELGDKRAIKYLLPITEHRHVRLRTEAAEAIYRLDQQIGYPILLRILQSKDSDVLKWIGPLGFANIDDPKFNDILLEMLSSEDKTVRRFAVKELSQTHDPRAMEPLLSAIPKGEWRAMWGLKNLGYNGPIKEMTDQLQSEGEGWLSRMVDGIIEFPDPEAVESLMKLTQHEFFHIAWDSVKALGAIGDPRASNILTNIALNHDDARMRNNAGWALTQITTPESKQALQEILDRKDIDAASEAYPYYINQQIPGSEEFLLDILSCNGYKTIAEYYAKCSQPTIAEAGQKWLNDHPYSQRLNAIEYLIT